MIAALSAETTNYQDTGLIKYQRYDYSLVAVSIDGKDSSAVQFASAFAGGSKEPAPPTAISANGNEDPVTVDVRFASPSIRLDSVNALVNFSSLRFTTSELSTTKTFATSDTGKVISETLLLPAQGWYDISAVTVDLDNNASPSSDTITAYAGPLSTTFIDFSQNPRFYAVQGPWDRTTQFFKSAPASFAYAPATTYQPNRRDTCLMYPYRNQAVVALEQNLRLSMDVAAFIDASDTMFLESASSIRGPWIQRAWWNASRDARWSDTTKGDDAWRREVITIDGYRGDTVYTRLRFRSNASRQSDGFFIDDLTWDVVSSVDERENINPIHVAPNPADAHINVTLTSTTAVQNISLHDAAGTTHTVSWQQHGRNVVIESSRLTSGFYILTGMISGRVISVPILIRH
jgi:hypothetical protein